MYNRYAILLYTYKIIHDDNILEDILFEKDFIILEKKYYLADIRYLNTNYFLYLY